MIVVNHSLDSKSKDDIYNLACQLGEIERHLVEDTDLIVNLEKLGIKLDGEISGYDSVIDALYELSKFVNDNIDHV